MKNTILIVIIAIIIMLTQLFSLIGIRALHNEMTELDQSTLLLEEIRQLEIENRDKGITIVNQQEIIDNQADEIWFCYNK